MTGCLLRLAGWTLLLIAVAWLIGALVYDSPLLGFAVGFVWLYGAVVIRRQAA